MHIKQQPVIFGVPWPGNPEAKFNRSELATLTKAADILERLRTQWPQDEDNANRTDVALAMYTLRELVEYGGFEL